MGWRVERMAFLDRRTGVQWTGLGAVAALLLMLTGCGNFFVYPADVGTGGGTAASTGDYAYIANSTSSSSSVAGYELSTGTPLAISGSPFSVGCVPNSMVVANNSVLFVSCTQNSAIYAFSIGSNGALTSANGGVAVANQSAGAMDITPDGKYLFVLNTTALATAITEYSISGTTIAAVANPSEVIQFVNGSTAAMKVAPSGDFIAIVLGGAGDVIVPLSNDLFSTQAAQYYNEPNTLTADFGVTVDAANNVYFARTGEIAVYSANGTTGVLSANTISEPATGQGDHAIVLNNAGTFVYTGNQTDSTISGFSSANGVLGSVTGSPFTAPTTVSAIALDNTHNYIVAAGYGTTGILEYAISSTGVLTASSTVATGTAGTTVMALTH
jgi:6-phosphogluconolactonase